MALCCKECISDKSLCIKCQFNPDYEFLANYYKPYEPTCPKGYKDCVNDPAYIYWIDRDWYNELYENMTVKEASQLSCNIDSSNCYDDEDK